MKLILITFLFYFIIPLVLNANNKSKFTGKFSSTASVCPSTYFDCGDGSCVSVLFLCDGEADCENGADEKCNGTAHSEKNVVCGEDKFNCHGLDFCLPNKWKCDGHKDCPSGEDEKDCKELIKCDGFRCKSGECIPEKWKCDNNFDCMDGSDEAGCRSTRINKHCIRENGYFECASGQCISHDAVCNGKPDCPDGDDEGKFCEIDGCHSKNCTHGCFQTPQGPQCDCNPGFKLNSDARTCVDVDECKESNNDVCSQKCINTKGSFNCLCESGFKLVNKTRCEVESSEPVLIYTDAHNVRGYWLKQKLHFLIARGLSNAMGVDMHRDSKLVFWTDIGENASYVFSAHFHSKDVKPVVSSGLKTAEDIAVDYVANNLYITDAGLKQIIVCKLDGSSCAPIIKRGIDNVRAIALDISHGRIFWTDWGIKPGIYTSRMDGSRMRALVNRNIIWPNGLTYDKFKNRIYWSDAKLERIEYYDLTKNKRFVLIDDAVYHPHCLTMFEDNLYWADWDSMSISKSNKFSGHNMTQVFKRPNKIYGMHIYHPVHYTSSNNPCWSSSCSHLCLIQSATEFKCACPNNMKLDPKDKTTCVEKEEINNLFVGLDSTIKQVFSKNIGKDITRKLFKNLPSQLEYISEYAYSIRNNELYLHNSLTKGIIKYDLKKQAVNSIIYQHYNLSSIYSMIYDEFSNNLYWLDTGKHQLIVASVNDIFNNKTRNPVILLDKLTDPSSMVLYQERNELYIAQMGTKPRIIVTDLNGKNSKTLVENIGLPTSLAIDKQKNLLYFADARKGTIESVSIDNPASSTIITKNSGHIESLAIDGSLVYFTDMDTPYLYTIDLNKNDGKQSQISVGYSKVTKKLLIVHRESSAINNDCINESNQCSDVCLFGGIKSVNNMKVPLSFCACSIDSSLSEDRYTCKIKKHCPDGYFTCESTKKCIRQSSVCDGHKDCENNEDESGCSYVTPCSMFESRCDPKNLTSHCVPNAWFCDGEIDCENGFDELNCHNQTASNKTIYDNVAHKSAINGQCENGYFKCDVDICIPWHFVCNGEINCKDKKDEGPNCLENCECKHNGRCHLNNENVWSCQCPPEYTGFDCGIKIDLQSRSNDNHEFVMKESIHSKGRLTSEDAFDLNSKTDSFWLIMLLVVIVLMIVGLILFGYIYMFETDGRMYLIKRNLNRKFNFRNNNSFRGNKYDFNSATADLLDQMECELDDEDNLTPQKQLNNQQNKYV